MARYLDRLLLYLKGGGKPVDLSRRPVTQELLEVLVEGFSHGRSTLTASSPVVRGTNMYAVRAGLLLDHVVMDEWKVLLGRACEEGRVIDHEHRLKTPGGYAKLADDLRIRDKSIQKALLREIREEGFVNSYRPIKRKIAPSCVIPTPKHGILQFFSGRLMNYPHIGKGQMKYFGEHKGKSIMISYFTMGDLAYELSKGEQSVINPETIEAAVNSYFWNRCEKIFFREKEIFGAADRGDLFIPRDIRRHMLDEVGISVPEEDLPLQRCRVYLSMPAHMDAVPAVRMLLWTDLFMMEEQFGPEYFGTFNRKGHDLADYARSLVVNYISAHYEEILCHDLFQRYKVK